MVENIFDADSLSTLPEEATATMPLASESMPVMVPEVSMEDFAPSVEQPLEEPQQQLPVQQPDPPKKEKYKDYNDALNALSVTAQRYFPSASQPWIDPKGISQDLTKKYDGTQYGYAYGIDNDDFYGKQEGAFKTFGKGVGRLGVGVVSKVGEGVGFIGSLLNPMNWDSDIISNASDNAFSNLFNQLDEKSKTEWLPTYQEADDRDKGFWSRAFTDGDFWMTDTVDGLAFLVSAWVPGLALSKLSLGAKLARGVSGLRTGLSAAEAAIEGAGAAANYTRNAATAFNRLDKFNAWALATASESMFEAKEARDRIMDSLSYDEFGRTRLKADGTPYTEEEKLRIAGAGAQNSFLMNAALLAATNAVELKWLGQALGKSPGVAGAVTGANVFGESMGIRSATSGIERFLNSKKGAFVTGLGLGIGSEGFVEENAQLAIQRINETYGSSGRMADLSNTNEVFQQYFKQTKDALMGNDPEAATSIGLGGILGGVGSSVGSLRQFNRDQSATSSAVEMYNVAQENWLKFGNIYKTKIVESVDAQGNPIQLEKIVYNENNEPVLDESKIGAVTASFRAVNGAVEESTRLDSGFKRDALRDTSFAQFVVAHINAGVEGTINQKLDAIRNSDPEQIAKLGFALDENLDQQINRYKGLTAAIIRQNELMNSDIIYDGSQDDVARKNKMVNIAADQAAYKTILNDLLTETTAIKNEFMTSENSSLSDGIVDQLNELQYRIKSQEEVISDMQKKGFVTNLEAVAREVLDGLKKNFDRLEKDNEVTVKALEKDENGFYKYEKEERNQPGISENLNRKIKLRGELQNHIKGLGIEWATYADAKNGKRNFLQSLSDEMLSVVDAQIREQESKPKAPAPISISKSLSVTYKKEDETEETAEFTVGDLYNTTDPETGQVDKFEVMDVNPEDKSVTIKIGNNDPIVVDAQELAGVIDKEGWIREEVKKPRKRPTKKDIDQEGQEDSEDIEDNNPNEYTRSKQLPKFEQVGFLKTFGRQYEEGDEVPITEFGTDRFFAFTGKHNVVGRGYAFMVVTAENDRFGTDGLGIRQEDFNPNDIKVVLVKKLPQQDGSIKYAYVDSNNQIIPEGEENIDNIVYRSLANIDNWTVDRVKESYTVTSATDEEIQKAIDDHAEYQDSLRERNKEATVYLDIPRALPGIQRIEFTSATDENGKRQLVKAPVEGRVITENPDFTDLRSVSNPDANIALRVVTAAGAIQAGLQPGRLVMQEFTYENNKKLYGDTILRVFNRDLTDQEKDLLVKVLIRRSELAIKKYGYNVFTKKTNKKDLSDVEEAEFKRIDTYLKHVINFSQPRNLKGKAISDKYIYVKSGLYRGSVRLGDFTKEAILKNRDRLTKGLTHHINNPLLQKNDSFDTVKLVKGKVVIDKSYKSYQEYLLAAREDGSTPPVYSSLPLYDSNTPQRTQVQLLWKDPSIAEPEVSEEKKAEKKKPVAKIKGSSTSTDNKIDNFLQGNANSVTVNGFEVSYEVQKGGIAIKMQKGRNKPKYSRAFANQKEIQDNKSDIVKNISQTTGYIYGANRAALTIQEIAKQAIQNVAEGKVKGGTFVSVNTIPQEGSLDVQTDPVVVPDSDVLEQTTDVQPVAEVQEGPFFSVEEAVNNAVPTDGKLSATVSQMNVETKEVVKLAQASVTIPSGNVNAAKALLTKALIAQLEIDSEEPPFRLNIGEMEATEDFGRLAKFMKEKLPMFSVNKMGHLIHGKALGAFMRGGIYIYENAGLGTGFHEAFEAVWASFLTPNEKFELVKEFQAREGSFYNKFTNETKPYSEASMYDVREMLAEEFRDYILLGNTIGNKIANFFKNLWKAIQGIFELSPKDKAEMNTSINSLFKKIGSGGFRNAKVIRDNRLTGPVYKAVGGLTQKNTSEVLEGINYYFFTELFKQGNNIDSILGKLDKKESNVLLRSLWETSIEQVVNNLSPVSVKIKSIVEAYKDDFYTEFKKSLDRYGVVFSEIEQEEANVTDTLGIRDAITIDPRTSTSTNVVLLLASLPQTITVRDKTTLVKNDLNQPRLVSTDRVHTTLLNELSNVVSIVDKDGVRKNTLDLMFQKLDDKYKTTPTSYRESYGWLRNLKLRLKYENAQGEKISVSDLSKEDILLRVAFTKSFSNARFSPEKLIISEDGYIYNTNPLINKNEDRIRDEWANNLKIAVQNKQTNLVKIDSTGRMIIDRNSSDYSDLMDSLKTIRRSDKVLAPVLQALSKLGIEYTASMNDLAKFLGGIRENTIQILELIEKEVIDDVADLFSRNIAGGRINSLISIESRFNSEDNVLSYNNAEGQQQFSVSQPSLLSNMINILNTVGSQEELINTAPWLGTIDKETGEVVLKAYQTNSELLRKGGRIFDTKGRRKGGSQLTYHVISGLGVTDVEGSNTATLQFPDRVANKIHYLLKNVVFSNINSDKSTEYGIGIGGKLMISNDDVVKYLDGSSTKIIDMYMDHLYDEMYAASIQSEDPAQIQYYRDEVYNLGHFRDIIGQDLISKFKQEVIEGTLDFEDFISQNKTVLEDKIVTYITDKIEETATFLKDLDIFIRPDVVASELYITNAIDNDSLSGILNSKQTINIAGSSSDRNAYTEEDIKTISGVLALNEEILLTEQHKLIYGHPALYKDLPKRANGATSTKDAFVEDSDIVEWMDDNMGRNDGKVRTSELHQTFKNISFQDMDVVSVFYKEIAERSYQQMIDSGLSKEKAEKKVGAKFNEDGQLASFILNKKKEFTGTIKAYMKLNEADAMAMGLPDAVRDILFMSNKLTSQREVQWDYEIAYEKLVRSGTIPNNKGQIIKKNDPRFRSATKSEIDSAKQAFEKGNPEYVWEVFKPQYFGYAETDGATHTVFLKHALQPKFYRHVEGTQFEKLYIAAQKDQVDIIGFESGQKVGNVTTSEGKFVSVYNEVGDTNVITSEKGFELPTDLPRQKLYSRFYGIQVEQSSKPKKFVVKGSQVTKQVMSNFYVNGKPVNETIGDLIKEYNETLRELMKLGKEELIKEIGLERDSEGNYEPKDISKLVSVLRREAESRDLPDNLINSINFITNQNDTQSLEYEFDTLINRDKIDNILNSIVDSRVISQKMSGKSSPQIASTLYESAPRNYVYLKDGIYKTLTKSEISKLSEEEKGSIRMQSSDLKFYHSKDGKIQSAEVYITWPFEGVKPEELGLKLVNGIYKVPEGGIKGLDNNLLKALAFRIPTQGMNSIESIIIKGFTPTTNGDMIVVPSEIVGKAGSDFDIDKLNIYLANYSVKVVGEDFSSQKFKDFLSADLLSAGADQTYVDSVLSSYTPKQFQEINDSLFQDKGKIVKGSKTNLSDVSKSKETQEDLAFIQASLSRYVSSLGGRKIIQYINPNLGTKASLQNKLINIMSELVLKPENYAQLVAPNTTDTLKDLSEQIKGWKVDAGTKEIEDEKSPTYLRTFIGSNTIRERYLTAKRMVGIAAVHSTFHVMAQVAGIKLNSESKVGGVYYLNSKANDSKKVNIKLDHYGKDENGLYSIGHILDKAGNYISDLISQALSGFVDGAKDPFVFDLNFSLNTAGTWFYLQHHGVPVNDIAYFFNQPVLDSLFKETAKNRSTFKKSNGEDLTRKELFYKVVAPYYNKIVPGGDLLATLAGAETKERASERNEVYNSTLRLLEEVRLTIPKFNPKELEQAIKDGNNADPRLQIAVLMDYIEYEAQSRLLSNFMQAISYDTYKTKTVQENMSQVSRWERSKTENFINNPDSILENTFLGEVKMQKEDEFNMFRNFFITLSPEIQEVFEPLYAKLDNPEFFIKKDDAVNLLNKYQNFILAYILHTTSFVNSEGKEEVLNSMYKDMFTGDNSFANRLYKYKASEDPNISDNLIIKELLPMMTDDATKTDNIMLFRNKMDTFQINNVVEAYNNLKSYGEDIGDTDLVKFSDDLAKFSILQSGFQSSFIDYKKVLSTEIYSELVKTVLDRFKTNPSISTDQIWKSFHQNNWFNRSIVPKAPSWLRVTNGNLEVSPNSSILMSDYLVKFVRDPKITNAEFRKMQKNKSSFKAFTPILFERTNQETSKGKVIYTPIPKVGNGNRMLEIYKDNTESILPGNVVTSKFKQALSTAEGYTRASDLMKQPSFVKAMEQLEGEKRSIDGLKALANSAIAGLQNNEELDDAISKKEEESAKCNKGKKA